MADRLELEARFNDHASKGVRALSKTLESVKPSNGMELATKWMQGFRREADSALRAVRPVSSGFSALGVGGLAASFSLGEIVKQLRELGDSTLSMRELGRESGMTLDQVNRLKYAAAKLHVDPGAVTGALKGWSSQMLDFRMHVSKFYQYLNNNHNGDIAKKIAGEGSEEAFKDTLDYLSRIPAAAMRAGKSAADAAEIQRRVADMAGLGDVLPMAADTDKLKKAFADAAREVKPTPQELIDASERMNASTVQFGQSWKNLENTIGPSLIDPLTGVINRMDAVFKEGEKIFSREPEAEPPRKPDGSPGESAGELLGRTGRNTLRTFFSSDNEMAKEGQWLWDNLFGVGSAHAEEMPRGRLPSAASAKWRAPDRYITEARARRVGLTYDAPNTDGNALREHDDDLSPLYRMGLKEIARAVDASRPASSIHPDDDRLSAPSASDRWEHPDDDRLSRARPDDLKRDVQEGSKAGIIAGLRELAQQQELEGTGGGTGGTLGAASRLLGRAAMAVGARPRAGSGFSAASGGGVTPAKGALAANQKIAYQQFLKDGWSPTAAHAMVANDSGESLAGPSNYHWDRLHMSGGIVQWDPQRAEAIKQQFGDYPWKLSVADQARAQSWEIRNNPRFAATLRALQGGNGAEMIGALVDNYEGPANRAKAKAERMGFWRGFNPDAQATPGAGTPTPSAAAIGDAAAQAARMRILNGGRDPADHALIERYKKQQNSSQSHARGGPIRGPGTGTSDSIPAWLSNGEFVVRAGAARRWGPLLHAINGGHLPGYADGGEVADGLARHRSWRDFFRRSPSQGGMGAPDHVAVGAMAMMMGESGRWMNPAVFNPDDVNGPSGGSAQWHDVTTGPWAGKIHRFSDLMRMALLQHEDWHSLTLQQANFKREASGPLAYAWAAMRRAKTAVGALSAGVHRFEVPAQADLEVLKRMPNIVRLAREGVSGGGTVQHEMDPLDVTIRHHPHTGHPIVTARAGKGVRLNLRTGPTMRPT